MKIVDLEQYRRDRAHQPPLPTEPLPTKPYSVELPLETLAQLQTIAQERQTDRDTAVRGRFIPKILSGLFMQEELHFW